MCEDRYNKSEGYCGQKEMTAKEITAKEMTATADDRKREEKITKLTNGPVYPLLVKMAVPSMIGMIVSTVYSMTDKFFIGQLDDVDLTASVGIVFSFVSVIQAIGFWFPFMGYYILCGMFLQNIGRFAEATLVTVSENGLFLIPSVLILPGLLGLDGLIWCKSAASAFALLLSLVIGTRAMRRDLDTSDGNQRENVKHTEAVNDDE